MEKILRDYKLVNVTSIWVELVDFNKDQDYIGNQCNLWDKTEVR